jgi:Xaa-Pro aminopeptidase
MGYLDGMRKAFARSGVGGRHARVGVEPKALPLLICDWIREVFHGIEMTDATPALEQSRKIKTSWEVQALQKAARLGDAAQSALISASREYGRNEFEVWTHILEAVYRAAGEIVPVFGELVTGPRTNEVHYPGGPRDRVIARGDTGILDISMRTDGYWSDCCNTVVFGDDPSAEQRKYMQASMDSFDAARDALRPGIRCCDVSDAIERVQARHEVKAPRYYGHQIGVVVNEHPRIIPSDTTTIEPGMVFCAEPGAYAGASGTTGARFEKAILVTAKGGEILHRFQWGL